MAFSVELKDAHILHTHVGGNRAHVDSKVPRCLLFFEPGAGLALGQIAFELRLEKLGGAIGQRRDVVAYDEGENGKTQAQNEQGFQCQARPQAAGAQNSELRAFRKPGHHEDGAD